MIAASACLCGFECRYDGKANTVPEIEELYRKGAIVPVCPEQMGGLSTPRVPAEIQNGVGRDVWRGTARVMSREGKDVTEEFKKGALEAWKVLADAKIPKAILKERSPSCGSGTIYDGSFSGKTMTGMGVTTALFLDRGILVMSEQNFRV
jgi:uncharacterized protein YbbK (DUF523 family)